MSDEVLIGIDVGTTRIKAVAFDTTGAERASAETVTPWLHVPTGTEIDADVIAHCAIIVAASAAEQSHARAVGIGVTGMGESGVLLDRSDRPVVPMAAWHDQRGDVERVRNAVGNAAFVEAVGMPLDPQPSLCKILAHRASGAADAAVRFLSVPEWIARCLGGDQASELSLASRTGLLDYATATPWDAATELVGGSLLAPLMTAGECVGIVHGDVPAILHGAALTVAGHDHQVAALAVGAARPGYLFNSLGTAEGLIRYVDGALPTGTVCGLVASGTTVGRGVVDGCITLVGGLRTGMALQHLASALGLSDRSDRIAASQASLAVDVDGLAFSVCNDHRGVTIGPIGPGVTPAAVWAVAVRDLVAASAGLVDTIDGHVGRHTGCVLAGGWLHDPALRAAKLRQFERATISAVAQAGAYGAAYLAGVAAGLYPPLRTGDVPLWSATLAT